MKSNPSKILLVIAGPNGSGKSSLISESELFIGDFEIINPDNYARGTPGFNNLKEQYIIAMDVCENIRNNLLELGKSFGFETVASKQDKIEFIKKAESKGYVICLLFVTAGSPEKCCERIAQRVRKGGHNVPREKVYQRYDRTMNNLHLLIELSDEAMVFDNSGESLVCVLQKDADGIVLKDTDVGKEWVDKFIRPYL